MRTTLTKIRVSGVIRRCVFGVIHFSPSRPLTAGFRSPAQAHYASSDASTTDPILAVITNMHIFAHLEVFGLFWFDFEDPEFWAMARSDWCITSHQWAWSEEEFCSGHTLYPTQGGRTGIRRRG